MNSTLLVLFLSGMVAMIMIRTLYKDIKYYNAIYEKISMVEKGGDDLESNDILEETGWKLVHADVFRPPSRFPLLLATMTGTGVQLLAMIFLVLGFAVLGFLSPANRGSLLTCLLLLFIFMGVVGGYVSARVYVWIVFFCLLSHCFTTKYYCLLQVQNDGRKEMETKYTTYGNSVSRISGSAEHICELLFVAQELHESDSVYNDACSLVSLGRDLFTFDISRCILWLSKGQDRITRGGQFDSEIHTTSKNCTQMVFHDDDFRSASVWLYFHRSLLYHVRNMASSGLLSFWICLFCTLYPLCCMF